jgi:hypothetical protein
MGSTIIALLTIRSLQDGYCLMTAQSRYLFYLVHQSLSLKLLFVRGKSSEKLGHYKLLQKVGKSFAIFDLRNLQSFSQIYNPVILCSISWIFMHPHFLQFFRDNFFLHWMHPDYSTQVVGDWADVAMTCRKGHLQPQVLFYEAVSAC